MKKRKQAHSSSTHIIIGFVIFGLLYYFNTFYKWYDITTLNLVDFLFLAFVVWTYSQMPDVDQPGSKINKYVTVFGTGVIIYAFYNNERMIGVATAIILGLFRLIEHRTVIHSLVAGLVLSVPLYFIKPLYGIIAFIMFLAHIISEGEFSVLFEHDWKLLK